MEGKELLMKERKEEKKTKDTSQSMVGGAKPTTLYGRATRLVKVKKAPEFKAEVMTTITSGTEFQILEQSPSFTEIKLRGFSKSGYINTDFCEVLGER